MRRPRPSVRLLPIDSDQTFVGFSLHSEYELFTELCRAGLSFAAMGSVMVALSLGGWGANETSPFLFRLGLLHC